jgi:ABC-2 type transport system permease protein
LKKQFAEVFRNYFYDQKKNRLRSKGSIALWFILFGFLMIGVMGGMFTFLAFGLCGGLAEAGMSWLYFAIMSGLAITIGTFGSVFSTYSSLYLPKDNDLLLSMPIPVRTLILARLMNVYLLGTMYAATAMLPTLIVHWLVAGATAANVICGILLFLIVTLIVLILSCVLGWIVAKLSLKLKNKSFITVLISLAFIGGYYYLYFRAHELINDLIQHAAGYGESVRSSAYVVYLFGRIGEGDLLAAAIFTIGTALILALTLFILSRGFLKLATSSADTKKVKYIEKRAREKSPFGALLGKEFRRFTSSPNYMLNCGLGIIFIVALGVFLLIQGDMVLYAIGTVFYGRWDAVGIVFCVLLMTTATMVDTAAPSVSLEGRSIWIPQSLPVLPKTVLQAKTAMQMILSGVPMLFASVCAVICLQSSVFTLDLTMTEIVLIAVVPLLFTVFMSLFGMALGVKNPILNWTTDVVPIKQSGAVVIAIFGGWGFVLLFAAPYILLGSLIGLTAYLAAWAVILIAASVLLYRRIVTKGAEIFANL